MTSTDPAVEAAATGSDHAAPDPDSTSVEPTRARPGWVIPVAVGAVIALLAGGFLVALAVGNSRSDSGPSGKVGSGPNVLVIMTDDQTYESMRVMSRTNELIGRQGTVFSSYYVSFPNCCPSRATYLTGQYAHNNGVRDNLPPLGGWAALKPDETVPVWMQRAGYRTAHIGKYLNLWGSTGQDDKVGAGDITPPPGYDHWFGLIDPTTYDYFNYSVSVNGERFQWGDRPEDYQTDVLGQEVVNTVTRFGAEGKPWFVSFTPLAPHTGGGVESSPTAIDLWQFPVAAPRHQGMFKGEPITRGPAWNEADVSKKPAEIRKQPPIDANFDATQIDTTRREYEALQAVDEAVEKIINTLRDTGQLDNTLILFTSDNGSFHGEHRIPYGKTKLYEEASHVPFMMRGPGVPVGVVAQQFAGNVDLAPTILAAASGTAGVALDGRDLRPLASDSTLGTNRSMLLENWITYTSDRTWALRGGQWYYSTWSNGDRELYDMSRDPYQVNNVVNEPSYAAVVASLDARLNVLKTCAGATCEDSDASRAPK